MAATSSAWAGSMTWENAVGMRVSATARSFRAIGFAVATAETTAAFVEFSTRNGSLIQRELQFRSLERLSRKHGRKPIDMGSTVCDQSLRQPREDVGRARQMRSE